MYFAPQSDFMNTRVFLPPELQYQPNKKTGITLTMLNSDRHKKQKTKIHPEACGPLGTDMKVQNTFLFILDKFMYLFSVERILFRILFNV